MGLWPHLLAYVSGLISAVYLPTTPVFPGLTLAGGLSFLLLRRTRLGLPLLLLFFWALGITLYHQALTPPTAPAHIRAFVDDDYHRIYGTVLTVIPRYSGGLCLDLEAETVAAGHSHRPVRGRVRLYIDQGNSPVSPGQRIAFRSRLRVPQLYGIPGEFDFPRHLALQHIYVTAFLADSRGLALFVSRKTSVLHTIEQLRATIGRQLDNLLPEAEAALLRALLIGDKSKVAPEQRDLLARGGVSHLFAISGLHLGLIFFLLYTLARQLYTRSERLLLWAPAQRVLPLLLLPALLFYLLFTGNALSTRRALLMLAVVTLLLSRARQTPPLRLWVVCALLFLLWEPLLLFQPAFQLSFAALLGILALTPRWLRKLTRGNRLWRYPATLALTTTAATLSTVPLVLLNFHLLAPAGILTNLFAIPAIGVLALPLGQAGMLLLPVWQQGAQLLLQTCAGIIQLTLLGVEQILLLPGLQGVVLYPPPQVLFALFLLCTALLLPAHGRGYQKARGMLLLSALLLVLLPSILCERNLTVTALSVGQGDATLLSFAGGHHVLVDGGGTQSKHFDIGERLLAPALGFLGVRSLDAVILSHDHPDHRQGLLYILRHFPVRAFWSAMPPARLEPELAEVLRRQNIPTTCPPPGWSQPDPGFAETLWLFVPDQSDANLNNRSLVILAGNGNDAVLLTGDLEQSGLTQLLKTPLPRSVNLLKIPHHGSRNSSPEKLLQRLPPQLAFMSLGKKNPYQFPHAEVIKALEQRQIPYWSTAADNSLKFSTNGSGWQATHWNQRLFR